MWIWEDVIQLDYHWFRRRLGAYSVVLRLSDFLEQIGLNHNYKMTFWFQSLTVKILNLKGEYHAPSDNRFIFYFHCYVTPLGETARWLQMQPSESWPRRRKCSKMFSLCITHITHAILLGCIWIIFHFKIISVLRRRYLIPIRCDKTKRKISPWWWLHHFDFQHWRWLTCLMTIVVSVAAGNFFFIQYFARNWPWYSLRGLHIRITWFSLYGIRIPLFSLYGIHMPLFPYMVIQPIVLGMALLRAAMDSPLSHYCDVTMIWPLLFHGIRADVSETPDNALTTRVHGDYIDIFFVGFNAICYTFLRNNPIYIEGHNYRLSTVPGSFNKCSGLRPSPASDTLIDLVARLTTSCARG